MQHQTGRLAAMLGLAAAALAGAPPQAATTQTVRPHDERPGYVWPNGPSADPSHFPIGVWLQSAANAGAYGAIGINLYVGQWQGPTEAQLRTLSAAGMPVIATQNDVGLAHRDDPTIVGWLQQDEPDNAQPDGRGGYAPCVDPSAIVRRYEAMRAADPSRPVWLNLGQGVAHDLDRPYVGRGSCAARWDQYPEYVRGGDIVSFDIYPVTSPYDHIRGDLWRLGTGLERLRAWSDGRKIVWNVVETAHIHSDRRPTPRQIRAEVWISLVHGSRGIVYFAHEWQPSFREAALLHYADTRAAVRDLNAEIRALAPALNAPDLPGGVTVTTGDPDAPVAAIAKRVGPWTYVFAVAMRDTAATAAFTLSVPVTGTVEVIGEGRHVPVVAGGFRDAFEGYGVHLYRFPSAGWLGLPWAVR